LYQVTNLALLCEDVVEGMVAANGFRGSSLGESSIPNVTEVQPRGRRHMQHQHHSQLEIVVDIEQRDWDYRVEAGMSTLHKPIHGLKQISGALRRIVMNLFGNAQKFTHSGYIIVELRILDLHEDDEMKPPATTLSLKIRDSGKGMSSEYMERKLYHPFAQEDAFAPGVGLGLSIV
jgi:signal transduction histidine kinase